MFQHKLTLPDGTVLGPERIRSVTVTEQVSDCDDLCPGAACAACAEVELWAPPGSVRLAPGAEFTLTRVDAAAGTQTPVGVFCVLQPQKASANVVKVTAYDRMTLLDKDLSPWLRSVQGQFPMTLGALAQAVCTQCGVTLAEGALDGARNQDYAVQAFYADSLTGRQLIQWAAQAMGRFARMTPAGNLEFAWYTGFAGYGIGPGDDAAGVPTALGLSGPLLGTVDGLVWTFRRAQNGYFQGGLSYADYETAPLDKVQIKQSDDDVGVLYPPDETGTNAFVIQGNLLLTTASADALRPVAQALYEQLQGVTYTPLEVSLPLTAGAPVPGQIIAVTDAGGRTMQAYVMQRTVTGQRMTLTCTGNARRDGTAAVNSRAYQNRQGKMLELQLGIDGLNVKASELQGDYAQLSVAVDGIQTEVAGKLGLDEAQTLIDQSLAGLTLSATAGDQASTLTLKAGGTTLSSATISFNGMVTFADLAGSGTTVINGDNITAGSISSANGQLSINLETGTFSTEGASANMTFNSGVLHIHGGSIALYNDQGKAYVLYVGENGLFKLPECEYMGHHLIWRGVSINGEMVNMLSYE